MPPSARCSRATSTAHPASAWSLPLPPVHSRTRDEREEAMVDIIEDIAEIREIYGASGRTGGQEAIAAARKAFARFHRAVAVPRHRVGDPRDAATPRPRATRRALCACSTTTTLLIPDRLGNNRVDTIGNLLTSPGVGLIFFVPGLRETLRVNGRARITTDPALLETVRGARQGAAQRHPGDRRGSLFPLRQGADPLRSVEPGKACRAIGFPVARTHHHRADRRGWLGRGGRALYRATATSTRLY